MRQLSEGSAQRIVLLVVKGLLDVVSLTDGVLAVIGVGLVRVKVDFAEESGRIGLLVRNRQREKVIGVESGAYFCS